MVTGIQKAATDSDLNFKAQLWAGIFTPSA
jgi:hypothetical protein